MGLADCRIHRLLRGDKFFLSVDNLALHKNIETLK